MDQSETSIAILIPCYNEELTIAKVIADFKRELPQADIYVFDNNSSDKTAEIAKEKGVVVIPEKRQGKGYVVSAMFEKVDADVYVMVDGDDTYPAESVHAIIDPILKEEADMTVGTRLTKYTDQSFRPLHVFGNNLVISLVNGIFRSKLTDIMSGYRGFNRSIVKKLPLESKGFEVETQMVMQALYYQFKIIEVEIDYSERPEGSFSKLNTYSDGARVLMTIFNIAKAYRPMLFFGLFGLLFLLMGLGVGSIPVLEFFKTGKILHFPSAILATGLVILASLSMSIGIILDGFNYRIKEVVHLTNRKQ